MPLVLRSLRLVRSLRLLHGAWLALAALPASAQTATLYLDEQAWLAAVQSVQVVVFNASTVAKANEIPTPPAPEDPLGSVLTFESANTGIGTSFRLESLNDQWIFEDRFIDEHLSPGPIDPGGAGPFENDDFTIVLLSNQRRALSFLIRNNNAVPSEEILVRGAGGTVLASFPLITASGDQFYGIVASVPIHSVLVDEALDEEDITVARLQLADAAAPVPAPAPALFPPLGGVLTALVALIGALRLRGARPSDGVRGTLSGSRNSAGKRGCQSCSSWGTGRVGVLG